MAMGLTWKLRPRGSIWEGRDATGRFYAHASRLSGPWTVYVAPWGCGLPGGHAFGSFDKAEQAIAAADRYVAEHAETPPVGAQGG